MTLTPACGSVNTYRLAVVLSRYNLAMGDPAAHAKTVFWLSVLLAWPFFLWQVACLILHRPMPRLGRYLGIKPLEIMRDGQVDPAAVKYALFLLGAEFLIFACITIYAYINSSYYRRDY